MMKKNGIYIGIAIMLIVQIIAINSNSKHSFKNTTIQHIKNTYGVTKVEYYSWSEDEWSVNCTFSDGAVIHSSGAHESAVEAFMSLMENLEEEMECCRKQIEL